MGILQTLRKMLKRDSLANPSEEIKEAFGVERSLAGVNVTERGALRLTTVYACVNILSTILASLPLHSYRRLDRGKDRAQGHYSYQLLHSKPNSEMTSYSFRQLLMAHILLWGNGYAEVEIDRRTGEPVALWPLAPWMVRPVKIRGKIAYELGNARTIIPAEKMLHVKSLWVDGYKGISPIRSNMQAVGMGFAVEEFGARFFGEGANVGGVVEHPAALSDEAYNRLRKSMNEKYQGLGKSHRLMLLEEGLKYQRIGIPPNEAQFLETKRFQIEEICRMYNVPLHLVQEHTKQTSWGSGLEQMNLAFVIYTLRPHLVNWEQELNKRIFKYDDRGEYFAEFSLEGLLRGDSATRSQFYQNLFYLGAISPNDIRELENMNPIDGGDEHFIQLNMVPLTEAEHQEVSQVPVDDRAAEIQNIRRRQAVRSRQNIANSYKRTLKQAVDRSIRIERQDIMAKAAKILERDIGQFDDLLDKVYDKHLEHIPRHFGPSFYGLAEAISKAAADEIDIEDDDYREQVERFVDKYLRTFGVVYTIESKKRLKNAVLNALDEGEDPVQALDAEFDHWEEVRADRVVEDQRVQLASAVAKTVFIAGGITKLIWSAGGSEPCEFCEMLDGKVVGINDHFVGSGGSVSGKDGGTLNVSQNIGHPPVHAYCQCDISPG